jgi:phage terminase large subunit GpA-like protein
VYQYCKKQTGRRVFAIKGVGGEGKPAAGRPSKANVAKCPAISDWCRHG